MFASILEKYLNHTVLAGQGIQEYYLMDDKEAWRLKYLPLYEACTYGPPDLPRITSINADGIQFSSIGEFVQLFTALD